MDLQKLGLGIAPIAERLSMLGLAVDGVEESDSDAVLDLDITTNRPDCLNHLGVARELSALFRLELKQPDYSAPAFEALDAIDFPASVSVEDPELCPRYAARVISGIAVSESPPWLRERLEVLGHRPINNIVDATNFVLLHVGHPLHAFDYEKLEGRRIVVRTPRPGESIRTLDGQIRELNSGMLAICDARRPVALAGIMGGEESEISVASKTILLESAYFSPASIRGTAKALGMRTEASYRFERGADPEMPVQALNLASRLICQLAGGRCVSPVIDEHPLPRRPVDLQLRFERIRRILGMDMDRVEVEAILGHLGFPVQTRQEEILVVTVPSFRVDVGIEDDLVEEVGRHVGYDRIPSAYPPASLPGRQDSTLSHQQAICSVLNGLGFYEAIQYAFSQPEREQPFRTGPDDSPPIANPLSETDTHLRTTLIPGLLESVRRNLHHGTKDVRLFEIGKVYRRIGNPLERVAEEPRLGLVATGQFHHSYWDSARMDFHFFHFKGVLEALFSRLKMQVDFARCEMPFLHPGASALVYAGKEALGSVGELHPQLQDRLKCPSPVFLAEISLSNVFGRRLPEPVYRPLVRFPSIDRDFSFVIDKDIEFSKIRSAVQTLKIEDLQDLRVIDIYQGSHLPPEKISLTVRLTFANPERTLTQQEVSDSAGRVVDELRREFGVEQRS